MMNLLALSQLDPTITAYVLAVAKENPHLSLVEFIHESLRHHLLTDDEYDGELNDISFENIPSALLTEAVRNGLDVSTITGYVSATQTL